jgi:hypothetical protein
MIKNGIELEKLKKARLRAAKTDYFQQLQIFEDLYREAKKLGVFPLDDPLEGIDNDIRLAAILNVRATSGDNRG